MQLVLLTNFDFFNAHMCYSSYSNFQILVITKRRIGKSFSAVQDAINSCNIVSLPAEHAELLLKLLPTKEEVVFACRLSLVCFGCSCHVNVKEIYECRRE